MSTRIWSVWDANGLLSRGFATLRAAERFAHDRVKRTEQPAEVRCNKRLIVHVRCDALGRVWSDVVDGRVA